MNTNLPPADSTSPTPDSLPPSPPSLTPDSPRPRLFRRTVSAIGQGFAVVGRGLYLFVPGKLILILLTIALLTTSAVLTVRKHFLHHVPSGHMLVVIAKFGTPLADGQILAGPGQQGIREEVLGEGWHFLWPLLYETELKKIIIVPGNRQLDGKVESPKVGVVKALGGTPLPIGSFLAEKGQQGIWREVLLPGAYRLNPYGYEVKLVDMVVVKPGFVGVLRRKLGADGSTEFATNETEKGIVRDRVLQPGLYPINTEVYEVIPCPVGIYQTTYHYDNVEKKNTALVFDASDSNRIQLDCTIEWELKPEFWPIWLARFRNLERIESAVIMLNVKNISRNKGQNYGAEDFLDGVKREQFQNDFTRELERACNEDNVIIRHAFIRNIIIPDSFLGPKREEQLARETAVTQKEQTLTSETANDVTAAKQTIELEVGKVRATTEKMVAAIDQEITNLDTVTTAEIKKIGDEFAAKIAILEAQRTEQLGVARAESKKLVETAKSSLHKMQMQVFTNDSDAFLRYTMSQNLSPALRMRLFQSGAGTFWTNLGDKTMNLFVPAGK